ncbi:hypothetical protein K440DRAFT_626406 [Wilcoxina mikolae CBS 423.85]|nr:hypothetical protein K440DRAFT_626406 [Wilcoxina mikolae CBS 423.85]
MSSRFNETVLTSSDHSQRPSILRPSSRFNETVLTILQRRSRSLRSSSALRSIPIVPV